ncbi:MAG TPA: hypothetical protein VLZ77_04245 [Acidimicrobiales bacterium]|nr:hypothetical protein [Acidimicrobiales bacterium]
MTDRLMSDEEGVAVVGGHQEPAPATRAGRRRAQLRAQATAGSVADEPGVRADDNGAPEGRADWRPPRRGRRARRPGTVPTRWAVALVVVALAASAAAASFGLKWSSLSDQASQAAAVRRVSSTFLTDLTNFKPTTVDADFSALLTFAAGDFAKQANQFFGTDIRQKLEQAQAQSEGQVRNLYVQSLSGGKAEVFAVVDQTYLNTTIAKGGGQPVPDVLRVVLDLTQGAGVWKISEVSVLQAPTASGTPGTGGVPSTHP